MTTVWRWSELHTSRYLDRFMTVGRLNYLKKLFQYLKQNQSEDCLYLNIYSPERKTGGAIKELRLNLALERLPQ
jgi:carboxylesterase type B